MTPWRTTTREKIHSYMNEIIRMACNNEVVPTWGPLIKRFQVANCNGWKIHKAMIELGYINIVDNKLNLICSNWIFQTDGKRVYERAKELNQTLSTFKPELNPVTTDEERVIEQLKAKLYQLQQEIEEKQTAFEKKNRLSKIGHEILEMFNISINDLKEIVSTL